MAETMALKDMPEDVTHPDHPLYAMFGRPWEANALRSGLKTFTEQGHDPMEEDVDDQSDEEIDETDETKSKITLTIDIPT